MELKRIILTVIIILVFFLIINALTSKSNTLSSMQDGNVSKIIPASELSSSTNNTSNFTYSVWFYVEDWTYRYGQEKDILTRIDTNKKHSPRIALGAFQNNLNISLQTYPDGTNKNTSSVSQTHNCNIKNVPIQSWVNALISVNGRNLDVYIDGKFDQRSFLRQQLHSKLRSADFQVKFLVVRRLSRKRLLMQVLPGITHTSLMR